MAEVTLSPDRVYEITQRLIEARVNEQDLAIRQHISQLNDNERNYLAVVLYDIAEELDEL